MQNVNAADKNGIAMLHALLKKNAGGLYADIWKIGLNLSLRIGDLLKLKYTDLDLDKRELRPTESKTGKAKCIRLNSAAVEAILRRLQQHPGDVYLFQVNCNRAKDKPCQPRCGEQGVQGGGGRAGVAGQHPQHAEISRDGDVLGRRAGREDRQGAQPRQHQLHAALSGDHAGGGAEDL